MNLHPRRRRVLEAVRELQREKGARPTYREIAERCKISKSTARDHVRELAFKGIIQANQVRKQELSELQKEVLRFVCVSKLVHGRAPALKEISKAVNIKNLSLVRRILMAIEMKGYIKKPYRKKLSIQVKDLPESMVDELSKIAGGKS